MLKSFWSQKKLHTGLPWNILIIPSLLLTSAEAEEGRQFEKNYTLKYWDVSVRHLVFETRNMLESKNNNKCFYWNIFFLTNLLCQKSFWTNLLDSDYHDVWGNWLSAFFPGPPVLHIHCRPWGVLERTGAKLSLTRWKYLCFGIFFKHLAHIFLCLLFKAEAGADFGAGRRRYLTYLWQ